MALLNRRNVVLRSVLSQFGNRFVCLSRTGVDSKIAVVSVRSAIPLDHLLSDAEGVSVRIAKP